MIHSRNLEKLMYAYRRNKLLLKIPRSFKFWMNATFRNSRSMYNKQIRAAKFHQGMLLGKSLAGFVILQQEIELRKAVEGFIVKRRMRMVYRAFWGLRDFSMKIKAKRKKMKKVELNLKLKYLHKWKM